MKITYYIVPKTYYDAQNKLLDYLPSDFAKEGFIHCTDGEYNMSVIANRFFKDLDDDLLLLFLDTDKIKSKVQYDDKEQIYPHIYGPLNRDAILKTTQMVRDSHKNWIFPIAEVLRS